MPTKPDVMGENTTRTLYCIVYLYSAQYLHILQDSKLY